MKKLFCKILPLALLLLTALCYSFTPVASAEGITITERFPDPIFRTWVENNCDTNKDGVLSSAEIDAVRRIQVSGQVSPEGITSLEGIELFTKLNYLSCSFQNLTALDVSMFPALTYLNCSFNGLTELNISGLSALSRLECMGNQLTELNLSGNRGLQILECNANQLMTLDLRGLSLLETLLCSNNHLRKLDLSVAPKLQAVQCFDNELTELNLRGLSALKTLMGDGNRLTSLDLSGVPALEILYCTNNRFTTLNLTEVPNLETLSCSSNQLTSLDLSRVSKLKKLSCEMNQFTELNISNCPQLVACSRKSEPTYKDGHVEYYYNGNFLICSDGVELITNRPDAVIIAERFPDPTFRSCVESRCDTNKDGVLSSEEIAAVKKLSLVGPWLPKKITSLEGVEVFYALEELDCRSNKLTELDVSGLSALKVLICCFNQLPTLNISGLYELEELDCSDNALTSLSISGFPTLKKINTSYNKLTSLSISDLPALEHLDCVSNQLTILNLRGFPALKELLCYNNQLTALDFSEVPALTSLDCGYNQLTTLDLSGVPALTELACGYNQLTTLDLSGVPALSGLDCGYNQLTTLDLSGVPALSGLACDGNRLTALNLSVLPEICRLSCVDCGVSELDISKCPNLIYCLQNGYLMRNESIIHIECYDKGLSWLGYGRGLRIITTDQPVSDTALAIDETSFPDPVFRAFVKTVDFDGNSSRLETWESRLVDRIVVNGKNPEQSGEITSLKGIEYFSNLYYLDCANNKITALDLSRNPKLLNLYCQNNQLSTLDISACPQLTSLVERVVPSYHDGYVEYSEIGSSYVLQFDEGVHLGAPEPDFVLPANLVGIEREAFSGGMFIHVVIPAQTSLIAERAFADCPNLRLVEIMGDAVRIADDAFEGVVGLTITGPVGGAGEAYAKAHNMPFRPAT